MNNLEKEFVPYEEALALKELGFDEPCFGWYLLAEGVSKQMLITEKCPKQDIGLCSAPTFSQAFRWFRNKKMLGEVRPIDDWNSWSYAITIDGLMTPFCLACTSNYQELKTYEEAELACLKKLIEIAKNNKP